MKLPLILTLGCCLTGWAADVAPSISTQPSALTVPAGCPVTFAVTAFGTAPLAYQWHLAGDLMAGATTSRYTWTTEYQTAEPSEYWVVVTNAAGAVTSAVATIYVTEPGDCQAAALPKVRMGNGMLVSMFMKADTFLPLALEKEMRSHIAGLTNELAVSNSVFMLSPRGEQGQVNQQTDFTLEQASNTTWDAQYVFKDVAGIGSISQAHFSPVPVWWYSNWWARADHQRYVMINGIFQNRTTLINPWFAFSWAHVAGPMFGAGIYMREFVDTNSVMDPEAPYFHTNLVERGGYTSWFFYTNSPKLYYRFYDTNGVAQFREPHSRWFCSGIAQYDAGLWFPTLEGVNATNELHFCGLVLLKEPLPPEVVCAKLLATNWWDYMILPERITPMFDPHFQHCQHNKTWLLGNGDGLWAWSHCPLTILGDSGSPNGYVLNNQYILDVPYRTPLSVAQSVLVSNVMLHLWTNAGYAAETCPGFEFADLSGFRKLR